MRRIIPAILFAFIFCLSYSQGPSYDLRVNISDRHVGWTSGIEGRAHFGRQIVGLNLNYLSFRGKTNLTYGIFKNEAVVDTFGDGFGMSILYGYNVFRSKSGGARFNVLNDVHVASYAYLFNNVFAIHSGSSDPDPQQIFAEYTGSADNITTISYALRLEVEAQLSDRFFFYGNMGAGIILIRDPFFWGLPRWRTWWEFGGPFLDVGFGYQFGRKGGSK